MKIDVIGNKDGSFDLTFDGTSVVLSGQDLKVLLRQLTQVLAPDSAAARAAAARAQRFLGRIKEADDVDVQTFIQAADHDDVVVLLKAAENDSDVRQKLFRNMSETLRKIFVEDMEFRFKDAVPEAEVVSTLDRLTRTADQLRNDGRTDL